MRRHLRERLCSAWPKGHGRTRDGADCFGFRHFPPQCGSSRELQHRLRGGPCMEAPRTRSRPSAVAASRNLMVPPPRELLRAGDCSGPFLGPIPRHSAVVEGGPRLLDERYRHRLAPVIAPTTEHHVLAIAVWGPCRRCRPAHASCCRRWERSWTGRKRRKVLTGRFTETEVRLHQRPATRRGCEPLNFQRQIALRKASRQQR